MKKWSAIVLISSFIISSCSTDFNVTTSWKDITIAYGLLDASDSAQFIKVGKAYLDPSTNAYTIAQNPDSLYYKDLNVELQEYNGSSLVNTIHLDKVDGNLQGLVKATGIFANSPNTLYKTKQALNTSHSYTLLVTKPDNGTQVTASTKVINDFTVIIPTPQIKVNFLPGLEYKVNWNSAQDGKIYDITIRFHYTEINIADPSIVTKKYVDWLVVQNFRTTSTNGGSLETFSVPNDNLYPYLGITIPDDQSVHRKMDSCDFLFSVGGEELDTYNQVSIAQQGLTSGQALPTFTNINGGLGLFSSRFHKNIVNLEIDGRTIDSIACNINTAHLNFLQPDGTLCH